MDNFLEKIKFKHLRGIVDGKPDYPSIMTETLGYNNNWLGRRLVFTWKFKQSLAVVNSLKEIDITKLEYKEDSRIKKPHNIDSISFRARMETEALLGGSKSDLHIVDLMTELIAIVCFEANYKKTKYDSESFAFNNFKTRILESPMFEIAGLYNWIDEELNKSHKVWEERFMKVYVEDRDYQMAGGQMMNNFNIVQTLKTICREFNVSIDEAWHQSYALVQTNSLANATQNYIQDQMRILKESRMRQARESRAR